MPEHVKNRGGAEKDQQVYFPLHFLYSFYAKFAVFAPYWSNQRFFFIFDIRALWRSVLSARAPECQKLTRSSANAEGPRAHCHLKSCKMLLKCSMDCIWKGQQPVNGLQCHSTSLPLLRFDRPYTIFLLVFHCMYICVLHRFWDINVHLFAKKWRRHVTSITPIWGQFVITRQALLGQSVHKIWRL